MTRNQEGASLIPFTERSDDALHLQDDGLARVLPVSPRKEVTRSLRDARPEHRCEPPTISGMTVPMQPDWACAKCGRIWRDMNSGPLRWWAEVQGPTRFPRGERL